jgi:hypothetical protein
MEAAKAKHADVVKRLLAAGTDPKAEDRVGRTAADRGKDDPEVTAALGGTPAAPKAAEVSPEQRARARQKLQALGYRESTEDYFVMSAHQGEIDAAQAFLDYGLSIESKDSRNHATTPLLAAATHDDPALAVPHQGGCERQREGSQRLDADRPGGVAVRADRVGQGAHQGGRRRQRQSRGRRVGPDNGRSHELRRDAQSPDDCGRQKNSCVRG